MFVRSTLKAEPINRERIKNIPNIEIISNVQVTQICGENSVSSVLLNTGKRVELSGVFIAIGMLPQNQLAKSLGVNCNEKGEICIDRMSQTNVLGVMAAGDVTDASWKQGIIASAEGSVAAYSAFEYINSKK